MSVFSTFDNQICIGKSNLCLSFCVIRQPEAEILKSETINDSSAPVVAPFSSRGPNNIVPDILKVFSFLP